MRDFIFVDEGEYYRVFCEGEPTTVTFKKGRLRELPGYRGIDVEAEGLWEIMQPLWRGFKLIYEEKLDICGKFSVLQERWDVK